jgi:hypothetical protein
VQDVETTLVWQRSPPNKGFTLNEAYNYCKSLRINNFESEWRLPDIQDLQSLLIEAQKPTNRQIDLEAFPRTRAEFYWSGSMDDTRTYVAAVFFGGKGGGYAGFPTGRGPNKRLGNVRCVRGELNPEYKVPDAASYNLMRIQL